VIRRKFGQKGDEVTEGRRKVHNEELHDLPSLPSIIGIIRRRMRLAWHLARIGRKGMRVSY
jgi:hypothetical protein